MKAMPTPSPDAVLPAQGLAAIFYGPEKEIALQSFAMPALQPGEVLVRILCTTICASDLHTFHGRRSAPCPCVLGHEIVGTIVRFGADSPQIDLAGGALSIGDRVTWTIMASCGQCHFCERGLPQKCESLFKYGHASTQAGREFVGGYAEYCVLRPGTGILKLPSSLPDTLAAIANCAAATVAAALRLARMTTPLENARVLVLGAGALGLIACAMLHEAGAQEIYCCDIDAARASRALDFGASRAVHPEELAGEESDVAFEFTGSSAAVSTAMAALRVGGTALLAGTVLPCPTVALDPELVVRRMLTIRGLHNYAPEDLVSATRFLEQRQQSYPLTSLVGEVFPLKAINQAFASASARSGLRIAICP